jgi:hypothetical protein
VRSSVRTTSLLSAYAGVVLLLVTVFVSGRSGFAEQAVLNPSAARNLSDWSASSEVGQVLLTRVRLTDGPSGATTAVGVQRRGGGGAWAFALAGLASPEAFFVEGRTYRMRAYVRDLRASGETIGLLLANSNFSHQPTQESQYRSYDDRSWHLLQRTFVATAVAESDTGLYFQLPLKGRLHWQITLASVREVRLPAPPSTDAGPSTVLSFDGAVGASPDSRIWTHEVGGHGWGSDELQTYTKRPSNSRLNGRGELVLTARRESARGSDGILRPYTSARLTTLGKFRVPAGSYVEASIRAPVGVGVRPAFWLLGANYPQVGWPASGELDILEATQVSTAMVRQAMHMPSLTSPSDDAPYGEFAPGGFTELPTSRDASAHQYGVYFDDRVAQFYINRRPTLRLTRAEAFEKNRAWPFGQAQVIVLNIAIGADPSATRFPVSMTVSDIRIWHGGVPLPSAQTGASRLSPAISNYWAPSGPLR